MIHPAISVVSLSGATIAAFLMAMLTLGGVHISPGVVLALAYGGLVVAAVGFLSLRLLTAVAWNSTALTIVVGSSVTSLALTAGCLLWGRSAAVVLAGSSLVVIPVLALMVARTPRDARLEPREALSVLALAVLSALWCHVTFGVVETIRTTNVLPLWSDYFIHGTEIAQFGDRLGSTGSAILLVNEPVVFYHYASYMLPAAVAGVVDAPGVILAVVTLLPYGILMATVGAYAFGRSVGNDWTALIAAFALLLVPDASRVWLRNGFFGFHWLLFTAPGSGYGIGVGFATLALVVLWKRGVTRALWLALFLAGGLFEFRAQLGVLFLPALVLTLFWETEHRRGYGRIPRVVLATTVALGIVVIMALAAIRSEWLGFSAYPAFIQFVHTAQTPTAYDGVYSALVGNHGQATSQAIGLFLLVAAALGALMVALPIAWFAVRHLPSQPLDSYPFWCLGTWLLIVLLAPRPLHGDFTEFQHRSFVWVYGAWLVWTVVYAARIVNGFTAPLRWAAVFVSVATLAGLAVSTYYSDPERPTFNWGRQYFRKSFEPGLFDAAVFVRSQANAGDVFACLPMDTTTLLDDTATRFAALANIPVYVARPAIQALHDDGRRAVVEQRLAEMHRIATATDLEDAFAALRRLHVRFLIRIGAQGLGFDLDRSAAVFRSGDVSVYRIDSHS